MEKVFHDRISAEHILLWYCFPKEQILLGTNIRWQDSYGG